MKQITERKNCTGCQACRLLCPKQCIGMIDDVEGFPFTQIDEALCVDCGVCASRCPENARPAFILQDIPMKVFGARYKNNALLSESASGGVFIGIAKKILETPETAVFGCAFDENIVARHICVSDFKNIGPLQSSKYVQSDVGDTYKQARRLLEDGKTVFYTGTPCQIAGLYAFLGKLYDNLLTADLICHGVPSPLLFKKYIDRLGKKYGGKIIYYNFRHKKRNGHWLTAKIKTAAKTKAKIIMPLLDPYYSSFLDCKTFRECCYVCKHANSGRPADITLGDFWGVEAVHPEFFDRRGVSVILVNTSKGEQIIRDVYENFELLESSFDNAAAKNGNLLNSSNRPEQRAVVYKDIYNENIDIFKRDCFKTGNLKFRIKLHIKSYIKKILPSTIIEVIKNSRKRK